MKKEINHRLGAIVSIIGAVLGIAGHFIIFQSWYFRGMAAESAEEGCEMLLKFIQPALSDIGILGGIFFAVAAYGFFQKKNWSFFLAVIGIVLSLQGAWFINVPYMAAGLPPVYFPIFFPFLIIYFILLKAVGKLKWIQIWVGLLAGLTFILTLMNGVSSLSRIMTIGAPLFVLTQRLHWIAMIGCGIVAVAVVIKPSEWVRVLGLVSCLLEVVVGIPLVIFTTRELGRFSLFSLAPIGCLLFLILLGWPGFWKRVEDAAI